uniref:thioredoxin-dependent peroxiredoxin n=1 Tax=Lygus hesperus TaxID=30085 RepID=A0A0A9XRC9_LYGHE
MLLIRREAPKFTADAYFPNGVFKTLSLDDYQGKWVVLIFYPLAFTFACTSALTFLSDCKAEFDALNAQVIGVSVDSVYTTHAWTQVERKRGGIADLNFPIVSDLTHSIGKMYDCLLPTGHHCRATYIIDPNGIVRHFSMNEPAVERNVGEILRIIQACKSYDVNGEVCPANWRKGGKTIKTDVNKKNEYFEAVFGDK